MIRSLRSFLVQVGVAQIYPQTLTFSSYRWANVSFPISPTGLPNAADKLCVLFSHKHLLGPDYPETITGVLGLSQIVHGQLAGNKTFTHEDEQQRARLFRLLNGGAINIYLKISILDFIYPVRSKNQL